MGRRKEGDKNVRGRERGREEKDILRFWIGFLLLIFGSVNYLNCRFH